MNQDRRITDKLPNEELVFTDRNLTAAALAHLEAERAAACLVHAGDDVWVGVGTKPALRSLLSEDTASQSQAVPSELASLQRFDHLGCLMIPDETGDYYAVADVQSLFSHSAATGKVPDPLKYGRGLTHDYVTGYNEALRDCRAASPAAPLAGKAEPAAEIRWSPSAGCWEVSVFYDFPQVASNVYELFSAPLAAAVPAEEASDVQRDAARYRWMRTYYVDDHAPYSDAVADALTSEQLDTAIDEQLGLAPAEPAPIQSSALTPDDRTVLHEVIDVLDSFGNLSDRMMHPDPWNNSKAEEKIKAAREVIARLSKPTAQGTASEELARFCPACGSVGDVEGKYRDCCPDGDEARRIPRSLADKCRELFKLAISKAGQSPAQVTGEPASIDTPEFRKLLVTWCESSWEGPSDSDPLEAHNAIFAYVDRHIAAQATAGRDAQQWISVDERLPEQDVVVALLDETRWMNTGSNTFSANWHGAGYLCEFGQKYWHIFGETRSQCLDAITHWLPLPPAPHAAEQASGGAK